MDIISYKGRTSIVYRFEPGLVCKIPWPSPSEHLAEEFARAVEIEKKILEKLTGHPRIIEYCGPCNIQGMKDGLLLREANCGDLQSYMEKSEIPNDLRKKWSIQLAEAVAYIHDNGVIHMNLSTTNVLVHQTDQTIDVILADFGGSKCPILQLSGGLIPDDLYLDPQLTKFDVPRVDVFSLGVIIYIIITGQYPFHQGPVPENEEWYVYSGRVQKLYKDGSFPDLSNVPFGEVIAGCCCERRFETAREVLVALQAVDESGTSGRLSVA